MGTMTSAPVRLLLLAFPSHRDEWLAAASADARFEPYTADAQARAVCRPETEAVVTDAGTFDSAEALLWYLADFEGVMSICMPEGAGEQDRRYVAQRLPCRPQVIPFDRFNLPRALDDLYTSAGLRRTRLAMLSGRST